VSFALLRNDLKTVSVLTKIIVTNYSVNINYIFKNINTFSVI